MKRRELLRHLEINGCLFIREGAKHSWWQNASNGKRASIPRHSEINDFLARKICKELDIPSLRGKRE